MQQTLDNGNRDDRIYSSIAQGRSRGMLAWGSKIPSQQIWELVAYIRSMGTAQGPDPPVEPPYSPENNAVLGIHTQTPVSEVSEHR